MPEQFAQESLIANAAELRRVVDGQVFWRSRRSGGQCPITEPLVRAMCIMKDDELLGYVVNGFVRTMHTMRNMQI